MEQIKAIDLFSGCGGTTAGLKKAGIDVISAVEIDKNACRTYSYNNPEVKLFNQDIRNTSGIDFPKINKNDHLLLVACPPCQGFSSIRKDGEHDIRNELVFEYERLIHELKPDFLLMENVAGMMRKKGQKIFNTFISYISEDYEIVYKVLNAADYGVPQTRKRLVLHGIKKELVRKYGLQVNLPKKTHSKDGKNNTSKWNTVSVILDLPPLKAGEEYIGNKESSIYNHVTNGLSDLNVKRLEYSRLGNGSRTSWPIELQLECHKNRKGHTDVYGILDPEKPSVTITGGCMTLSKGRFGHPYQNRALSAREAARLQSFDDNYIFFGNHNQLAMQIGNAVPVKLAQASGNYFVNIAKEISDE